jgi:hypothetical protein
VYEAAVFESEVALFFFDNFGTCHKSAGQGSRLVQLCFAAANQAPQYL